MSAPPVRSQKMEVLGTMLGDISPQLDEGSPLRRYLDIEVGVNSHSWRRCAELHHIDPEIREPPPILIAGALRLSKGPRFTTLGWRRLDG